MKKEEFQELFNNLDGCNRHQLKKVMKECVELMMEMLPPKKRGGF